MAVCSSFFSAHFLQRTRVNTAALLNQCSYLSFSKFPSQFTDAFTALPTTIRLLQERVCVSSFDFFPQPMLIALNTRVLDCLLSRQGYNISMQSIVFEKLFINTKSGASTRDVSLLKASLAQVLVNTTNGWYLEDNTGANDELAVGGTGIRLCLPPSDAIHVWCAGLAGDGDGVEPGVLRVDGCCYVPVLLLAVGVHDGEHQ